VYLTARLEAAAIHASQIIEVLAEQNSGMPPAQTWSIQQDRSKLKFSSVSIRSELYRLGASLRG
jgi:hypothetical protein